MIGIPDMIALTRKSIEGDPSVNKKAAERLGITLEEFNTFCAKLEIVEVDIRWDDISLKQERSTWGGYAMDINGSNRAGTGDLVGDISAFDHLNIEDIIIDDNHSGMRGVINVESVKRLFYKGVDYLDSSNFGDSLDISAEDLTAVEVQGCPFSLITNKGGFIPIFFNKETGKIEALQVAPM